MQYSKTTLLKGETIVISTSPHFIVFGRAFFMFLIAMFFYLNLYRLLGSPFYIFGMPISEWLSLFAFIFAFILTLGAIITYKTSEYVVTNKRVLMKTGFIQRYSLELFLDKIEAIHVNQTILGRMLNYGQIDVIGTGGSTDVFADVPNPLEFRQKVQQQIDSYLTRGG